MPDETLSAMLSREKELDQSRAAEVLRELAIMPAQTPVDYGTGVQFRLTQGENLVIRLHYSAIPERDPEQAPEWKRRERRKYTSQASWDREQEIVDEAGGGERVFADILLNHWDKIVIEDPSWRPDPAWEVFAGFDHGKTNPTALERAYVDFDGVIYFCGEYYMPGKEIYQHAPQILRMSDYHRIPDNGIISDPSIFNAMLQQTQRPGHAPERARSFAELYYDVGVTKLVQYSGDAADVSFAGRLMQHWSNLDQGREPTVKIICRKGLYADKPVPGLYDWDCPNLLWELMIARRVQLSAQQLLSRNISEAIVDKDNHARDAMKYFVMSLPEPAKKPLERRIAERVRQVREKAVQQGATADQAATNAMLHSTRIMHEEIEENAPQFYSGKTRRRIQQIERQRRLRGKP